MSSRRKLEPKVFSKWKTKLLSTITEWDDADVADVHVEKPTNDTTIVTLILNSRDSSNNSKKKRTRQIRVVEEDFSECDDVSSVKSSLLLDSEASASESCSQSIESEQDSIDDDDAASDFVHDSDDGELISKEDGATTTSKRIRLSSLQGGRSASFTPLEDDSTSHDDDQVQTRDDEDRTSLDDKAAAGPCREHPSVYHCKFYGGTLKVLYDGKSVYGHEILKYANYKRLDKAKGNWVKIDQIAGSTDGLMTKEIDEAVLSLLKKSWTEKRDLSQESKTRDVATFTIKHVSHSEDNSHLSVVLEKDGQEVSVKFNRQNSDLTDRIIAGNELVWYMPPAILPETHPKRSAQDQTRWLDSDAPFVRAKYKDKLFTIKRKRSQ